MDTITTRAATDSAAEAMPEVMLLAISSPRVYLAIGSTFTPIMASHVLSLRLP